MLILFVRMHELQMSVVSLLIAFSMTHFFDCSFSIFFYFGGLMCEKAFYQHLLLLHMK